MVLTVVLVVVFSLVKASLPVGRGGKGTTIVLVPIGQAINRDLLVELILPDESRIVFGEFVMRMLFCQQHLVSNLCLTSH